VEESIQTDPSASLGMTIGSIISFYTFLSALLLKGRKIIVNHRQWRTFQTLSKARSPKHLCNTITGKFRMLRKIWKKNSRILNEA
jgi:hypothetical protein